VSSRADISPDRQLLARASPSVRCLPSLQVRSAEVFSPAMLSMYLLLNHSNTWILELDCVAAVVTASSSPPELPLPAQFIRSFRRSVGLSNRHFDSFVGA